MNQEKMRYWQIDALRGIAIIMMITYHIMFDLTFLGIYQFPLKSISLQLFLYPIGSLFLLLVGISLVLSYQQFITKKDRIPPFQKYLKRGSFLFILAILITIFTWIYPHNGFIVFGVIHCISISIIISYWLISKPKISLISGIIIIIIGIIFYSITISNPYLFWLGLKTPTFYTLDYFPLFPWVGVIFIGIFLGQEIYPTLKKKYVLPIKQPKTIRLLTLLGKHALIIYFIHQPIIFGILYMFINL